jgi:hypothetical protein
MVLNVEHAVEIILHISKVLGVADPRNLGVTGPIGWLPKIDLSMTKHGSSLSYPLSSSPAIGLDMNLDNFFALTLDLIALSDRSAAA